MAGRRPKPTQLRKLNGNAGHRALPTGEPQPSTLSEAAPPEWLPEMGGQFWEELAPMLSSARVLTEFDRPALAALAAVYALWRQSYDYLQSNGSWYEAETKTGETVARRHPASIEEAERWKRLRLMLVEFGLTPAGRSRVARVGDVEAEDPAAKWLNS